MKFVYPWMLILVALVPVAGAFWVWLRARTERRLNGLVAPSLQRRLMPRNPGLFNLQATLLLTGLFLVVFAAARPQLGHSSQKFEARSRNVVVALDVSRSMLAEDLQPNRLERAKADVADLIDSLEGDRCALVAFRRTGVLLCPLTTDHAFLRAALEGATPDSAPRGETDLGGAIKTALDALDPAADDHNAILLISDGGDLRGGALDAARAVAKRNVPIFTVGLGDPKKGSGIPDASGTGLQQYKGQGVTTKLEEKALVEIAKASGGRYVPLATAGTAETTLGAIYQKFIRQVAAKEQAEEEELRATERFGWFLVPGLLLMLLAGCFSRGRFAGRNVRAIAAACLCFGVYAEARAAAEAPSTNVLAALEQTYVPPAEGQLSDREIWNKGYDAWKAGDMTNALVTLRGLTLSRTHGARAAEIVGTILHANRQAELTKAKGAAGVNAESAVLEPLRRAEKAATESAGVLQLALRAQPDDPRTNRNFTRAVTGVKELRDELHVQEVQANAKGRNPQELMTEAAREALALLKAQAGVLTNEAAVAVRQSESLARRAEKLSDALIPLKRQVLETVTNEQQAATIVGDVEATRDRTLQAAELLADLSPSAAESLSQAETAFHRYWKGMLDPPTALMEDLRAQTNAYLDVEQDNGRDWQREALDLTQVFRAKFPAWVQQKAQEIQQKIQQGDTNAVPFTKEAQDEITQLAAAVEAKQRQMVKAVLPPEQLDILAKLERIRELLPKDDGGGASNQPQNNPQQNQKDQNKDQQDDQQKNDQDQQQDQQEQPPEQKEQKAQPEEPKDQKEIEELLRKAQERSKEHENEKKARMNKMPLSPNERDW